MARPVIIQQPMAKTVPPTEDVNFTCTGQAYGDVNVSWFLSRRNNPVSLTNKAIITTTIIPDLITSVLTIPNVLARDERRYRCRLTNSAGSLDSDSVRLSIGSM